MTLRNAALRAAGALALCLPFAPNSAPAQDLSRIESTRHVYRWTEPLQVQAYLTDDRALLAKQFAGFGAMAKAAGVSREEIHPGIVEAYAALKEWTSDANGTEPLGIVLFSPAHALRSALETWSLSPRDGEIDSAFAAELADALKTGVLSAELGERHFNMAQAAANAAAEGGSEVAVAAWRPDPATPKGVEGVDRNLLSTLR